MNTLPVSVVIRTIGRPNLLRDALASLSRCNPAPSETVIVDQSRGPETAETARTAGPPGTRVVSSRGIGRALAANEGIQAATHNTVFMVDDDCVVREDWIAAGWRAMKSQPDGLFCGQVLPAGDDPRKVPSAIVLEEGRDFTGDPIHGELYTGNMVCSREAVLVLGGLDPRVVPFAEDSEFCFRWLSAGRNLRHVPDLVVWHRDWRTPKELERLYVEYYRGMGMFYAKHLWRRDRRVLRMLAIDLVEYLRSIRDWLTRGSPRWTDVRRGALRGLPFGLARGIWEFRRERSRELP